MQSWLGCSPLGLEWDQGSLGLAAVHRRCLLAFIKPPFSLSVCLDSLPQPSKTNTHATLRSKRAFHNFTWTTYISKVMFLVFF